MWGQCVSLYFITSSSCVFRAAHQFEMVTLSDQLICVAEDKETLLTHLVHILKVNLTPGSFFCLRGDIKSPWTESDASCDRSFSFQVILPGGVSYAEVGGASAVSKVCVVKVGGASSQSEAWLLLWEDGVSIHPVHKHPQQTLRMELSALSHHGNSLFVFFTPKRELHLQERVDSK